VRATRDRAALPTETRAKVLVKRIRRRLLESSALPTAPRTEHGAGRNSNVTPCAMCMTYTRGLNVSDDPTAARRAVIALCRVHMCMMCTLESSALTELGDGLRAVHVTVQDCLPGVAWTQRGL